MALTPKQDRFCIEYLLDLNATQAAIRAGYSEKSARQAGSDNLGSPEVQERIAELRQGLAEATGIQVADVVKGIAAIEQGNIFDYLDTSEVSIRLKDIESLPIEKQRIVSEVNITPGPFGNTVKLKLYDRQKAQDMLMKHLGGYVTSSDLIDKLPPERLNQLVDELIKKLNRDQS